MTIPCRCEACSSEPAPTWTEQHRHECEVRLVIALPDKLARMEYLYHVREQRGAAARLRIVEDMPRLAGGGDK